jgi:PAS domain S-box-containing protein
MSDEANINAQLQAEIDQRLRVESELRQSLDQAERARLAMLSAMEDQQRKADACVLNAQRVDSLLRLNRMIAATPQELMDYALEESVRLTRSAIGYLAFLNEDESVLTMNSWSHNAMAECAMADKPFRFPVADTGLWGEAVRQRQAVITNDYAAANPLKKGCPHGHVSLRRHMNVPVFEGSRIVIVAGVGNKDGEYDLDDVQELTLLMDGLWRLLEHRRSDEALRESEQRYRSLFSGMNEGFALHELLFDKQGLPCDYRFLTVNPAFERLTGLKAENLVGASQRQILPDESPFWLEVYSKVALTGEPIHVEHYSTQLQRHFEVFAYRPAPNRFATVFNDITERKRIEDVQTFLAKTGSGGESEPFFNALARYLAQSLNMDCVCIGRLEGDGLSARTVAVWCDSRFEDNVTYALKGTPCGDVVGKQVCCFPAGVCQAFPRDQLLKDLRAESYVGVTLFGHTGKPVGLIAVIGRGPLVNRPLAEAVLRLVAVRASGEIERQEAEAELQKIDKLQSVGTLAGGIAHDFNNILLGLFGNISIAMDDLPNDHPSYAPLKEAEKSMSRAVRLTKQLLTFAKGGTPVKENLSLGDMVEEVARFDLTGSNVSLVYHHDADLWPVEADKGQIQQVISNLVINARQSMLNGGHLTITLENADLPATAAPSLRPGRYVKVIVRDEGCGIEPKVIAQIFDPYFTTKQSGNGLGLATAWSIINKHKGHLGIL